MQKRLFAILGHYFQKAQKTANSHVLKKPSKIKKTNKTIIFLKKVKKFVDYNPLH